MEKNQKIMNSLKSDLKLYKEKIDYLGKALSSSAKHAKDKKLHDGYKAIESSFDRVSNLYSSLKEASEEKWDGLKESFSEAFEDVKDSYENFSSSSVVNSLLDDIKQTAENFTDEALDYGKDLFETLQEKIEKHPFSAALWGIGIGFLFGKLIKWSK